MQNKRTKGNRFQDWVESWVLKTFPGAAIHNQKTSSKKIVYRDKKTGQLKEQWISTRNDIFGCIDLICILPNSDKTNYIQATEHTGVTKRVKEMEKVPWHFNTMNVYLFQKRERGRVSVKQLQKINNELKLIPIGEIKWGKYKNKIEKGE